MKFVTNRITTGKSKSFADLVADFRAKKESGLSKTASAEQVVKTARSDAKQEEGESSGQLDVEPLHQKGESTPKVKGKSGDKDQGVKDKVVSSDASQTKQAESIQDKENENNKPAEESGQTKADFPKLTNDPEAGKHRDGDGDQKKEAAGLDNFGDKKAQPFGKKEEKKDEKPCTDKPCTDGKKGKKASGRNFVVIANLDSKSKSWLKKYWSNIFMPEYADAMTSDK